MVGVEWEMIGELTGNSVHATISNQGPRTNSGHDMFTIGANSYRPLWILALILTNRKHPNILRRTLLPLCYPNFLQFLCASPPLLYAPLPFFYVPILLRWLLRPTS